MSTKALARLTLGLSLLVTTITLAPVAEAGCETRRTVVITYYAWHDNTGNYPGWYSCTDPNLVGPQLPPSFYRWDAIGGETYNDCAETYEAWGDITSCTGPENTEVRSWVCGQVCDS
jgi:hypothetical protein